MKAEEYNNLTFEERANLLWGRNGKGKYYETWEERGENKTVAIYIYNDLLVSVFYDSIIDKVIDIEAWVTGIDKTKILGSVVMN